MYSFNVEYLDDWLPGTAPLCANDLGSLGRVRDISRHRQSNAFENQMLDQTVSF